MELSFLAPGRRGLVGAHHVVDDAVWAMMQDHIRQTVPAGDLQGSYEAAGNKILAKARRGRPPGETDLATAMSFAAASMPPQPGIRGWVMRCYGEDDVVCSAVVNSLKPYFDRGPAGLEELNTKLAETEARNDDKIFDRTQEPPPAGASAPRQDLPVHATMSSFLTAVRANNVSQIVAVVEGGRRFRSKSHRPAVDISAPAFDFGDLSQIVPGTEVLARVNDIRDTRLSLPYPVCYFLYTQTGPGAPIQQVCYLAETPEGTIACRSYLRNPAGQWTAEACDITLPVQGWLDGIDGHYRVHSLPGMPVALRDGLGEAARGTIYRIALATWILIKPKAVRERTEEQVRIPKRLMSLGSRTKLLSPVVTVHVDRDTLERPEEPGPGTGRTMPPHDRRKHIRRLRNGREIEVKACKVHGGSEAGRYYQVTQ